ncbi:OmpA family protein [Geoalkalibacter halelectricus]|uniref:OmpA family protein n=1 Tax=Geoalkalibacter halelectricus TaxID=2847045 RepID=UPI003D1A7ABB
MRTTVLLLLVIGILALWLNPAPCHAVPTQFGDTGLLSQPSAETLDAGNLSFGLWLNHSDGDGGSATVAPVALTLGLGSFLEVYGTYPNLLFNDDDLASGRGDLALGFKARVLGKRSSPFKLALDVQGRRSVADDPGRDGVNSYLGRMIGSYRPERFGVHANIGYQGNDSPRDVHYDNQVLVGGGIEFYPNPRARLIAELGYATEKEKGRGEEGEAMIGLQYFASPHLTLNLGVGVGIADASPDWRILAGMSTTQGIGTYFVPVPRLIQPPDPVSAPAGAAPDTEELPGIRPLSPLLAAQAQPRALTGVELHEMPVAPTASAPDVILTAAERLPQAEGAPVRTRGLSPLAPMTSAPSPVAETIAAPAPDESSQEAIRTYVYRKFRLPEFSFGFDQHSLSDEGRKAVSEIIADLRREGRWFLLRIDGHTDNVGSAQYNERLSLRRAIAMGSYIAGHEGLDPARIFVKGFGQDQPLADNETAEGRSLNRRVEILVLLPKDGMR